VPFARIALYVATIGALALVVRSLFIAPLSLSVAATAFTAYIALVLCGVFFLRLGMFLDVVWRGPKGARGVALTFDDGPSPEHTPRILAMLDEAKVKAAFFVIARKAEAHPEVVRDIAARGHAIGLHSYGHDRLFSLRSLRYVREDLRRGMSALEAITGERPVMFRPPIGHSNPRIAKAAEELGLVTVGWSVRALDGLARSRADRVAERVTSRLRHGAIVLLHDASERDDHEPASLKALPRILEAMRRRKLRGVSVAAWIPEAERAEPAAEEGAS
jgi:peptidoglycan/xylan/chitin deacetylase (PgdA/CDA1 family)